MVAQAQGEDERARALREEARSFYQDENGESNLCMVQGHGLLERGDFAAARSCYEEGLALPGAGGWHRPHERIGAAARAAALNEELAAVWAEGRRMKLGTP
jgi:hypothetical protein